MNRYLVLICCLATLVAGRPDVSLGYHSTHDYDSGSNLLSSPLLSTSYVSPASGDISIGGASSSSSNFLTPTYTVSGGGLGTYSNSGSSSLGSTDFGTGTSNIGSFGVDTGVERVTNTGNTGITTGVNTGIGTGFNTGIATGVNTGIGTGFNTGIATGLNTGIATGVDTGIATGVNTGGASSLYVTTGANLATYATDYSHVAPIITKNFYIHTVPEDHDEQQIVRYINIGQSQKNYRVVFIDAPTSSVTKARIVAQVAPVEEKTSIYVLAKKNDALDVSAQVDGSRLVSSKPDVHFIRYKTAEEAEHARHQIQAQFDRINGASHVSNEGIVPVNSVIGILGNAATGTHTVTQVTPAVNIIRTATVPVQTVQTIHDNQILPQYTQYSGNLLPIQTTGFSDGSDAGSVTTTTIHGTSQFVPSGSVNILSSGVIPESSEIHEVVDSPSSPPTTY